MATIMTFQSSSGKKRACTATCHNAKHDKCTCICGGKLHGSANLPGGVEQAVKNNWEEAIREAEQKAAAEGMELDTSQLRKIIGLEPANHNNDTNYDEVPPGAQWRLPLEVK